MAGKVSSDRLRLVRDLGLAEKELDRALVLLSRTQRAMVDAGSRIAELHASMLDIRRLVAFPPNHATEDDAVDPD